MDTWLDAVRNLRNYCAHPSMVVGMTSSVVIPDNRDSADVLPDNTNLYSRLYALKKILPQKDADMLAEELEKLISKTKKARMFCMETYLLRKCVSGCDLGLDNAN